MRHVTRFAIAFLLSAVAGVAMAAPVWPALITATVALIGVLGSS